MIDQRVRWQAGVVSGPAVTWPICSGRVPSLADLFSPRPETGYGIETFSGAGDLGQWVGSGKPAMTVLVGPSGYGKTYLAAAVVHGLSRSPASDLQVWVNASSRTAVLAGYAQAAADIGLADRGASPEGAAARFLEWLVRTDRRWIVVLDDVIDPAGLRGLWPAGAAGTVLVTCRPADMTELTARGARICKIGEFSPREALGYLTARLYDDTDQRVQALDLAADMGCMPLALALATATMAGTTLSCREYRLRLTSRRQELRGRVASGSVSPAEVAWSLALDRADQRPPAGAARPVLSLAAMLDPAGLPAQILVSVAACNYLAGRGNGAAADPKQAWAAAGNLARCGLLSVDQASTTGLITLHPIVQAAVRRLVPGAVLDEAARAAADALTEVWPQLQADPVAVQALRECAFRLRETAGDVLWAPEPHPILIKAGTSLADAGLARPAIAYWQSLLAASGRALGADHVQTLAFRDLLAGACEAAGQLEDAIDLTLISVGERERIQGPDHPDTLTARTSLARVYRAAGMLEAAIDVYERALADREWVLGTDHPDTLAARSQLAGTCHLAGQLDNAIVLYQRNVADWERVFGPDHRDALTECANLGRAYQSAGRIDDAIAIFRRVHSIREKTLGANHPDTLTACGHLAYAYRTAGRMKDAIPCYRQTLAGREAVLGPDHLDTLMALANMASCYHSAHRMKDAIPLYERLLADRERIQGADHPDTLTARGNLAGAYHSAGRLADALPVYERTLADFERVLGPDHQDTLTSRGNLAHAYYMARRHSDAIAAFEQTLADCQRVLGPDHPLTRTIRDNLDAASR
ncbi:MAG TPA: FxSxx-COOH system tetratricopeptide repeat protein [Streptosporangiaceae bacterium]|nr:FxSxx-COOH system tetratricopeptide repeat protein [Streptosporangiaceae bacterium]